MKKGITIIIIVVALVVVAVIFSRSDNVAEQQNGNSSQQSASTSQSSAMNWRDFELHDVVSGDNFRIADFKDKPVLLESFAVWCPTCTKQQKLTKALHKEIGDAVVSISIDTDPNEDEAIVKDHATTNGFDWYYAVAPAAMSRSLIDEFGINVVNAPSVPMILICTDGSAQMLKSGVKDVQQLIADIAGKCQV